MNRYTSPSRDMLKEPYNVDVIANKENMGNGSKSNSDFNAYLKPVGDGNLAYNKLPETKPNDNVDTSNLLSNLKIEGSGVKYVRPNNDVTNQ